MSGRGNRIRPPHLIVDFVTRCGAYDPGFIRLRRGLQTVGAAAATWATVSAVASLVGIPDNFRIALMAPAHACSVRC